MEHLLTSLPGGQLGFLIVVNVLIFGWRSSWTSSSCPSSSFRCWPGGRKARHRPDLVRRAAGVNMQTSFMHPPFGFALFYLRSVAPPRNTPTASPKPISPVTTMQIYWGAVPFVLIQVIMVGLIIFFPGIVSGGLDKVGKRWTSTDVQLEMEAAMPRAP